MVTIVDTKGIKPNQKKAVFFAKRQLAELVYDAVNLEGINYTLPEVQTLLDGITVGGHKLNDLTIALNQAEAWKYLFSSIENKNFSLDIDFVCELHNIAGKEEALEWGRFRSGMVSIAGTDYTPPEASELDHQWAVMVEASTKIQDVYDRAIFIFLEMARNQFFYDVNKRMGRFIMNGILLSNGYPAINLPAKRQLEFNQLMLDFYSNGDHHNMTDFMKSCLSTTVIEAMRE
ncbi:cell filamentation protein Fic (plasmid) [Piscirickettsia salmonis]|nr:cell filamentation protein Fic [Piscirickettsia salmonis]